MRVKRVNRYYCEHCNKGGCSAGHMRRHEERCTLNPERVCGMHQFVSGKSPPSIAELKLIAERIDFPALGGDPNTSPWSEASDAALSELREAASGCPVCVLAALRQVGKSVPLDKFDFRDAMQEVWEWKRFANAEEPA